MSKVWKILIFIASSSFFLQSCSGRREAYLTVQMCVVDQEGMISFFNVINEIAKSEKLLVADNSALSRRDLKTIDAGKHIKYDIARTIDIDVKDGKVIKIMIGNLGLPSYQVVLSFFGNSDLREDRRLSYRVIQTLSQHWRVETVPAGKGAFPMENCSDSPIPGGADNSRAQYLNRS